MTKLQKEYHNIAELAIEKYDLRIKDLSYFTEETNIFFKLTDYYDNQYLLKIFQEESSTLEDNLVEVFFISMINKDNNVSIPNIIKGINGDYIQLIDSKFFSNTKRVILYSWLEGEDLDENENETRFMQLGEVTALMHNTTMGLTLPESMIPRVWDKVFYYKGEQPVYKNQQYQKHISMDNIELLDKFIPYLDEKLAMYYKEGKNNLQLIHADLNPWNIMVDKGDMHVIDFEDSMLALPIHDIANMLFYYRYDDRFEYENVKQLYFRGYERVRPLPKFNEFDLDLLMTARRVNFINYVLLVEDDPRSYIEKNIGRIHDFLNKYQVEL
ncbi:phosphotransferase [Bacillus carboniphilus]|uniref:Phosphotransferase n=1 Tax=Bacillus carboniphilus TaxID=86663 RepID=A0ABY9JZ46_9BACI|nr:phosphotransferase [Bacillus carboniphilus]WLR42860.1 phosphotransferase [Bacillus carboniphilus]